MDWIVCFLSLLMLGLIARVGAAAAALFILPWFALAIRSPQLVLTKLVQNTAFLIIPVLAIVSTIWSDYPDVTLRLGVQFLLTSIIGILAGSVLRPTVFASALLCALTALTTGGVIVDGGGGLRGEWAMQGLFESKNMFAFFSVIQIFSGLTVLFDRYQPRLIRMLAVFALLEAAVCLIAAQSTGALVFSIPAIATFLVLTQITRLPAPARQLILAGTAAVFVAAVILAVAFADNADALLDLLGKDTSLTGRTYLWRRAYDFIDQAPLLGVGYQAFWRIGNPPAEELWAFSSEASGAGFNFHNLYLNTAVELGFAGLICLFALLSAMAVRLFRAIVTRPGPSTYFAATLFVFFFSTSVIEVELLYPFHLGTVLLGVIWAFSAAPPR
jgi:exopolysaccharide production protein ExoQ